MTLRPGDTWWGEFITSSPTSGAASDADSLPVCTASRNGSDTTIAVTVTGVDTGRYKATMACDGTWVAGDWITVSAAATVNGVAGKGVVDNFVMDTKWVSQAASDALIAASDALVAASDALGAWAGTQAAALSATGLDAVPTTAPAGVAGTFREMVVQTWRRWFKKSTLTATQLKTWNDAGTVALTTQNVSDNGTTQTVSDAA